MGYEIKNLYRASYLARPENRPKERILRESERLLSIIQIVLSLRIFFMFFDVLPHALERVVESVSFPLVAPFYFLVGTSPVSGSLEWVALFSLVIYSVIGYVVTRSLKSSIVSSPAEEYEV